MKTIYLLFFIATMVTITSAKAQVKVGTSAGSPNSGAILDAGNTAATAVTYQGIYLPQVALTANNIYGLNTAGSGVAVNGMMIYNTATAGTGTTAVTPGIYVWNNGVWNLVNTLTIMGNNKSIYEGDGTFTGNRSVNQAGFNVGFTSGKVGLGIATPTNQLQVVAATATTDPVRIVGLRPADTTAIGALVTDNNGVIRVQTANTRSAVRVTGIITNMANNVTYNNDATSSPVKTFDNLNEFSGHTFTAAQAGLYQLTYKMNFTQISNADDGGDGYLGRVSIPGFSTVYGKIMPPESDNAPGSNTVTNTILLKFTTGQKITFQSLINGSTNSSAASYVIDIVRVD